MNELGILNEPARRTPVRGVTDVLVAGAGPAGSMAALAAAQAGASVQLIETAGCLGGIWSGGLLSWILDAAEKPGVFAAFMERVSRDWGEWHGRHFLTCPEICKQVLEGLCIEAGVSIRLHTRVVATTVDDRRITHVLTESKSGREAWSASAFIDATGDGDLAALAGCGWDYANPENGQAQPFSLIGLVGGVDLDAIADCVRLVSESRGLGNAKVNLLAEFRRLGLDPSYHSPFMMHAGHGLFMIMWNHIYGACAFDAADVTAATLKARAEVNSLVMALRRSGGRWSNLHLVATADQIGTREGRRIHGQVTLGAEDVRSGARFDDAVCRSNFGFDVHATQASRSKTNENTGPALPYDIPQRALIAKDIDNLFLAGRCLSGDFLAHSSYRVSGIAAATGESAGRLAAKHAATRQGLRS
jgi:hypothetical protein